MNFGGFRPGDDVPAAITTFVHTGRMIYMSIFVRKKFCNGLENTNSVLTLVGFFLNSLFGDGDNFHLVRSNFPGADIGPPADQGVIFFQ